MKFMIISFLVLTSISAIAGVFGLPDQDPVVKNLRARYANASVPKASDLLNKSFSCTTISAYKDYFASQKVSLSFTFSNGIFTASSPGQYQNNRLFVLDDKQLIGYIKSKYTDIYAAYRVASNGDIISEVFDNDLYEPYQVPAITNRSAGTFSYTICTEKRRTYTCHLSDGPCKSNAQKYSYFLNANSLEEAESSCSQTSNNVGAVYCGVNL